MLFLNSVDIVPVPLLRYRKCWVDMYTLPQNSLDRSSKIERFFFPCADQNILLKCNNEKGQLDTFYCGQLLWRLWYSSNKYIKPKWRNDTMCWNTYISTAQICLLQGERKPLHTNFNYTLLPIQHVHATTTTVSTKSITRVRKIKTKRNAFGLKCICSTAQGAQKVWRCCECCTKSIAKFSFSPRCSECGHTIFVFEDMSFPKEVYKHTTVPRLVEKG